MSEEDEVYLQSRDEEENPLDYIGSQEIYSGNEHEEKGKHALTRKEREMHDYKIRKDIASQKELQNFLEKHQLDVKFLVNNPNEIKTACYIPTKRFQSELLNAERVSHKQMAVLDPTDRRKRVFNTTLWPHCAYGIIKVIEIKTGNCLSFGTGTMIGPTLVLTAAHNLFLKAKDENGHEREVEVSKSTHEVIFIPAANGSEAPYGILKVIAYQYPEEYNNDKDEDYAVLVLEENISEETGYFGLHAIPENQAAEYQKKEFELYGYPIGKDDQQWGMKGNVDEIGTKSIKYSEIETSPGHSGGGLYYKEPCGSLQVVGVHTEYNHDEGKNVSTRLSVNRVREIVSWMQNMVALTYFSGYGNELVTTLLEMKRPELYVWKLKVRHAIISVKNIASLATNEVWRNLYTLDLSHSNIDDKGVVMLAQNETWNNLQCLDLSSNMIGNEGAEALAANKIWKNIRLLSLASNKIANEGAIALAANEVWMNLQVLNLSSNYIGNEGAVALAHNKIWRFMRSLDLSFNKIGNEGSAGLALNEAWNHINFIDISHNKIDSEGVKGLVTNRFWGNLQFLKLRCIYFGSECAAALATNESWTQIQSLDLFACEIGDQGAIALATNKSWANLQSLNLSCNKIRNEGIIALAGNKIWTRLQSLNLSHNKIGYEGAIALANSKSWIKLQSLDLSYNKIENEGIAVLATNEVWKNLLSLNVSHNNIGNEGAAALATNKIWTNLQCLDLSENNIDNEGAFALVRLGNWNNLEHLRIPFNDIDINNALPSSKGEVRTNFQSLKKSMIIPILYNRIHINNALPSPKGEVGTNLRPRKKSVVINFKNNHVTKDRVKTFNNNPYPTSAKSFDFSYNELNMENLSITNTSTLWDNITVLNLSWNSIGPEGAKNLSWLEFLRLESLDLSFNHIGDEGVEYISQKSKFPNLQSLDLKSNEISCQGVFKLSENAIWTELVFLNISFNNILMEGAIFLIRNINKNFKNLKRLYLVGITVDSEEINIPIQVLMNFYQTKFLRIQLKG